jgi:kynurenine formamidase
MFSRFIDLSVLINTSERGFCHLEKLCNLESLPDLGFYISCFPVKIKVASAGWTRAIALI